LAGASAEVKKLASKKQIWKELEGSVSNINATTQNLNKVSADFKDEKIAQNIGTTIKQTNATVGDVRQIICELKNSGINQGKISSIINNTDKTASNMSCMTSGINKMLSERFLFLKLFFGKAGKHFDCCENKSQK